MIESTDSASAPPTALLTVVTIISVAPSIAVGAEKVDTPFAAPLFVTMYCNITILLSDKPLPITLSPK